MFKKEMLRKTKKEIKFNLKQIVRKPVNGKKS